MCGRFSIFSRPEEYLQDLSIDVSTDACDMPANYNACPSQQLPVVLMDDDGVVKWRLYQWGLIPGWAKDTSIGFKLSNARSETAAEKPSFRHAFKHQRCLVPVDGWYEWKRDGKYKQPFYHHRKDQQIIWLAGLWESWTAKDSGEHIRSFTILTRDATGQAAKIHNRMPVIITAENASQWLDRDNQRKQQIVELMHEDIDDLLEIFAVSKQMNSPRFNGESCIVPVVLSETGMKS